MYNFSALPPDQRRVLCHLYARWDEYFGGIEIDALAHSVGIGEQSLKALLEALVTEVESYDAGAAPVDDIIGPTTDDVLTLIT
ncbi:MAG: hypothetical protein WBF96_13245, partial [Phycisphaerae bacterium]